MATLTETWNITNGGKRVDMYTKEHFHYNDAVDSLRETEYRLLKGLHVRSPGSVCGN